MSENQWSKPGTDLPTALERFRLWKAWRENPHCVQYESDELKDGMLVYEAYLAVLAERDGLIELKELQSPKDLNSGQ